MDSLAHRNPGDFEQSVMEILSGNSPMPAVFSRSDYMHAKSVRT